MQGDLSEPRIRKRKTRNSLLGRLKKEYKEGHIDKVLFDCDLLYRQKEKMQQNSNFLLLYVKVLLETKGQHPRLGVYFRGVLLNDPENFEALDYLDILEAKEELTEGVNDPGEQKLMRIIKRSPKNAYAYFLLGAICFGWIERTLWH